MLTLRKLMVMPCLVHVEWDEGSRMNRLKSGIFKAGTGASVSLGFEKSEDLTPYRSISLEETGNQMPSHCEIYLNSIKPHEQKRGAHLVLSLLCPSLHS